MLIQAPSVTVFIVSLLVVAKLPQQIAAATIIGPGGIGRRSDAPGAAGELDTFGLNVELLSISFPPATRRRVARRGLHSLASKLPEMWRAYGRLLSTYPVRTQMASSAVIWCAGDLVAQRLERRRQENQPSEPSAASSWQETDAVSNASDTAPARQEANAGETTPQASSINWRRTQVQTIYATLVWAPMAHYWYETLDRLVVRLAEAGTWRFVGTKLALEMVALHPVSLFAFFVSIGLGGGDSIHQVLQQLSHDFLPSLGLEWLMWCA
jgi:protein Mpv17